MTRKILAFVGCVALALVGSRLVEYILCVWRDSYGLESDKAFDLLFVTGMALVFILAFLLWQLLTKD